jgi:hypothetical protein
MKRANTDAKARTNVKAKAAARPATTVARVRTPAKAKVDVPPKGGKVLAIY